MHGFLELVQRRIVVECKAKTEQIDAALDSALDRFVKACRAACIDQKEANSRYQPRSKAALTGEQSCYMISMIDFDLKFFEGRRSDLGRAAWASNGSEVEFTGFLVPDAFSSRQEIRVRTVYALLVLAQSD